MQNLYIKYLFRHLVSELQEENNVKYSDHESYKLGLMIGLSIVLILIYLSMWLPLIARLSSDVSTT